MMNETHEQTIERLHTVASSAHLFHELFGALASRCGAGKASDSDAEAVLDAFDMLCKVIQDMNEVAPHPRAERPSEVVSSWEYRYVPDDLDHAAATKAVRNNDGYLNADGINGLIHGFYRGIHWQHHRLAQGQEDCTKCGHSYPREQITYKGDEVLCQNCYMTADYEEWKWENEPGDREDDDATT